MGTRIASNLHFSTQKSTFATSSQADNSASDPLSIPLRLRNLDCSPVNTPPLAAPQVLPCFRGAVTK